VKRLFSPSLREALVDRDAVSELLATLPPELSGWSSLAQDQHLEVRTLLSSYILCSQGDRMLMAHSIEGRFPFLDIHVAALANTLPPAYKLRVLDEKHVLKRAAADLVPREILRRSKQPYRAPGAAAFCGRGDRAPAWIAEQLDPAAIRAAGVFDPDAVARLWAKCRAGGEAALSNADDMALTGVLSTQLLHHELIATPGGLR
jgi:asparagine synthase (glutamine-hydrolysing)